MTKFNYSLNQNEYTLCNALCWGIFLGHCKETLAGSFGHRTIHALIATVEFLPVISQIASLAESLIVTCYSDRPSTDLAKKKATVLSNQNVRAIPKIPATTPASAKKTNVLPNQNVNATPKVPAIPSPSIARFNIRLKAPTLVEEGMTAQDVQTRTKMLLASMKSEGRVMTKAQFENEYKTDSHGLYVSKSEKFHLKNAGFGLDRIMGKKWVDQIVKENMCDMIKTPSVKLALGQKISIFARENGQVEFALNWRGNAEDSQVYLEEHIEQVARDLSVKEAIQFATVLAKARYRDFDPGNFIIAKDGVYITDLDEQAFGYFGPPLYDEIYTYVLPKLADKHKQAFKAEWDKKRRELEVIPWQNETLKIAELTFDLEFASL